jgi:hypothetical protein
MKRVLGIAFALASTVWAIPITGNFLVGGIGYHDILLTGADGFKFQENGLGSYGFRTCELATCDLNWLLSQKCN